LPEIPGVEDHDGACIKILSALMILNPVSLSLSCLMESDDRIETVKVDTEVVLWKIEKELGCPHPADHPAELATDGEIGMFLIETGLLLDFPSVSNQVENVGVAHI